MTDPHRPDRRSPGRGPREGRKSAQDSTESGSIRAPAGKVEGPPTHEPEVPPPAMIGPYPILGELGRGGMGVVYLARDPRLDRPIALKTLPPRVAHDPASLDRLEREAKLLATLNHPNIATVHSLEESEGIRFLTMERVPGETLASALRSGPLPVDTALSFSRQVAAALEAAHRQGVVHRDLKPGNIMVTPEASVKVLDFGLAEAAERPDGTGARRGAPGPTVPSTDLQTDGEDLPRVGSRESGKGRRRRQLQGTPGYMSPEQLSGEPIDARTDVWAFGCILYECLTGTPIFGGRTPAQRIAATLDHRVDLDRLPTDLPPGIRTLLTRCLAGDRADRMTTIGTARRMLDEEIARRSLFRVIGAAPFDEPAAPNNLPCPVTELIGRESALADVKRLALQNRLLTLTGFGGVGKTRLAVEAARELLPAFPDGAWVIEMAARMEPAPLVQRLAGVLSIREARDQAPIESLIAHLGNKKLLLLLDNCENNLSACVEIAAVILGAASGVHVLATSREALACDGEAVYPVPPLGLPPEGAMEDAATLEAAPSVALFGVRARALSPDFRLDLETLPPVVRICRRLDGIPLAIELAATRVKSLPVEEIAARLDDRFRLLAGGHRSGLPHHQTLEALVDWSHDQLAPADRAVLRRLSVFVGGWSIESAELVCAGDGIENWDILDSLSRLVEKSMVELDYERGRQSRQARYRMLETVREYARRKLLAAQEESPVGARFREAIVQLAETAERHLAGPEQRSWFARLDADNENLGAAMDDAARNDLPLALRLAGALGRYWDVRGRWSEGRERLAALLAHPESTYSPTARAKALAWAGILAGNQGDFPEAVRLLGESLFIRRETGDLRGVANSLHALGNLAYTSGEHLRARALHDESLTISRSLGDRFWIARSLNNLGNIALALGNHTQAQEHYEESLAIKREQGDPQGIAASLGNLGRLAGERRCFEEAWRQYGESLSILRTLGDRPGIARSLYNLAHVAMKRGDDPQAQSCLEESLAIRREIRDRGGVALCLNNLGFVALRRRDHDSAQSHFSEAMALWEDLNNRPGVATCWNNLGNAAQHRNDLAGAEECFGRSLAIRRELNDRNGEALCLSNLGGVALLAGRVPEARSRFRESLELRLELDDRAGIVSCIESLGELAAETEELPLAARLIAAAQTLREGWELPLPQVDRADQEKAIDSLRNRMGPEAFERESESGRSLSLDEAIATAFRDR